MKTFRVFVHPVNGLVAVKAGFSWPALCFGWLWMLEKELWGLAALWCCLKGLVGGLATLVASWQAYDSGVLFPGVMLLGLALIAGANGNGWHELYLRKRRYELLTTVCASSPYEAVERAFGLTRHELDVMAPA